MVVSEYFTRLCYLIRLMIRQRLNSHADYIIIYLKKIILRHIVTWISFQVHSFCPAILIVSYPQIYKFSAV